MAGASIEATLELWASSLRDVKSRIRPLFTQERVAASAGAFLDGLLSVSERLKRIVPHDIAQVIGFPPAADSVYGVGSLETALRRAGKAYVLGVAKNHGVTSWGKAKPIAGTAESVAQDLAASEWKRLSAGEGTKGPRLYDWAYVELADIDASEYDASRSGLWTRGLLIRRAIANQDLAFFSTWAPAGTSIEKLVRVEGCRWAIEDSFETAKNELGLDHNETRSWHGWNRHVSLVMLAFAMMATIRHRANATPIQQTIPQIFVARRLSAGPFRKSPHSHKARPKAHRASARHRLVPLAKGPSGRRISRQKCNCNAKQLHCTPA